MSNIPSSGPGAPPPPVWDAQPSAPAHVRYGGFWLRLVAYVIDLILINVVLSIIAAVLGIKYMPGDPTSFDLDQFVAQMGTLQLLGLVVTWLYWALMESSARGATVGKMAVGLRVVDESGHRLSFLRATGRFFAKFVSTIILCIGFLMIAFTDRKRGLHDMIAGTLVIKNG